MWHPERPKLDAWRSLIVDDPATVHAAIDEPGFTSAFGSVEGDALQRVPPGYPKDHPDADLLRLKDVVFGRRLSDDEIARPDLPDRLTEAFSAATPVLRLLASLDERR